MKKYQIIYADPPWTYSFSGTRLNKHDDYSTMKVADICQLPVKQLADDNCILFIWMIWNRLADCLQVIAAWGFTYKSCAFTWVKRNKNGNGWFWGMGGWTRQNSEICLLATKGNPQRVSNSVHSVIDNVVGEHSKKPPIVRSRIVELMGGLPRIELFARKEEMLFDAHGFEGWDVWGDEVESDITI